MTTKEAMAKCEEIIRSIEGNAEWNTNWNPITLDTNIGLNKDGEPYFMTADEISKEEAKILYG